MMPLARARRARRAAAARRSCTRRRSRRPRRRGTRSPRSPRRPSRAASTRRGAGGRASARSTASGSPAAPARPRASPRRRAAGRAAARSRSASRRPSGACRARGRSRRGSGRRPRSGRPSSTCVMIAPSPGGRSAAIWSALKPPQEMPQTPRLPSHQGCSRIQARISSASSCSCCVYSSVRTPSRLARAAHVHAHGRVAVPGEVRLALRVAHGGAVHLPVGQVLDDRRHRVVLGVLREPDARRQSRAVGEVQPGVLDLPDAAREVGADARHYGGRDRLEHEPLAPVRERDGRVLGVDLAPEPVPVEDRLGDDPRRDAVADPVDGLDPLGGQRLAVGGPELEVERVVGEPLRDEDDGVGLELERLAELGWSRSGAPPRSRTASSPAAGGCRGRGGAGGAAAPPASRRRSARRGRAA